MKRAIALFVLGLIGALTPALPSQAVASEQCIWRNVVRGKHDFGESTGGVVIWNKYCWPTNDPSPKAGYVRAVRAAFVVNRDGSRASCNRKVDPWVGMEFRLYLYHPYTGRNWNTRPYTLTCEKDTTTARIVDLSAAPDFPYKGAGVKGVRPQWRVVMTEKWDWMIPDQVGEAHGSFVHP